MSSLSDTSVVILCHNRLDEVMLNVPPRVDDVETQGLELVVVDNASSDGTREYLEKLYATRPQFMLVVNDSNLGVGAGRNSGWIQATREFIVTLDEDTRISTEQIESLVDGLRSDTTLGIVTPVMFNPSDGRLQTPEAEGRRLVTNFHGACYAVRHAVIVAVGMHDPDCDFGGEELDLSIRTRAAGWEVTQHPDLRVGHNSRQRSGKVDLWRRQRWTRNHARVMWRWFPYPQALLWGLLNLGGQVRLSLRQHAFGEIPVITRAWLAGAWEGSCHHAPAPPEVVSFYRTQLGLRSFAKWRLQRRAS